MRTLVNRERTAVIEFLDEIAEQVTAVRARTNAATDGRTDMAHIELDFAHSALDEIADITAVLTSYLDRLTLSTASAHETKSGHGLIPPTRSVYTIPDDDEDVPAAEGVTAA